MDAYPSFKQDPPITAASLFDNTLCLIVIGKIFEAHKFEITINKSVKSNPVNWFPYDRDLHHERVSQ